jgi:CPA1 family monovalent cation:H+ antiporter
VLVTVGFALAGTAAIVGAGVVARRTGLPAAALLVLAGLVYAWLPGPNLRLNPTVILDGVIPPLLYSTALNSSAVGLRRAARSVLSLSVGLVLATAVLVGVAVHLAEPAVPLSAAIALGAAVSPPDPVASLAIGRRAGLPARLITIIEGEGLLNDATALTLFKVATAAAVGGGLSAPSMIGRFVLAAVGGIACGFGVAWVFGLLRGRTGDPLAENAISLVTPFTAYAFADSFGGSGVLAVVIAGLWLSHRGPSVQSAPSRLQARAVWSQIDYLLEGFVFLLIGQQLPAVIRGVDHYPAATVAGVVLAALGVVLFVRPVWLLLSERVPSRLHTRQGNEALAERHRHLTGRETVALTWAGTRGVITLAAAFSLPVTVNSGTPLPGRNLLLFAAYLVVLVTLVGQGLTFKPVVERLRLPDRRDGAALLRNEARIAAVKAGLERLDQLLEGGQVPADVADVLRRGAAHRLSRYQSRVDRLSTIEDGELPPNDPYLSAARARRSMIDAERDELVQWRDAGRLPDSSLRVLQRELDHEEDVLPGA